MRWKAAVFLGWGLTPFPCSGIMERQALLGAPLGKAKEGKNKEQSNPTGTKIILVLFF